MSAEACSLLINNDLHMHAREIPKNCISLVFRADRNCFQPVLTSSAYKNTIPSIMISV
jgi:hypothetical protein